MGDEISFSDQRGVLPKSKQYERHGTDVSFAINDSFAIGGDITGSLVSFPIADLWQSGEVSQVQGLSLALF